MASKEISGDVEKAVTTEKQQPQYDIHPLDYERLRKQFQTELIACGWRDQMQAVSGETIRSKGGVTEVTIDDIAAALIKQGKSIVPNHVQNLIMKRIRDSKH